MIPIFIFWNMFSKHMVNNLGQILSPCLCILQNFIKFVSYFCLSFFVVVKDEKTNMMIEISKNLAVQLKKCGAIAFFAFFFFELVIANGWLATRLILGIPLIFLGAFFIWIIIKIIHKNDIVIIYSILFWTTDAEEGHRTRCDFPATVNFQCHLLISHYLHISITLLQITIY